MVNSAKIHFNYYEIGYLLDLFANFNTIFASTHKMSRVMKNPAFYICENKVADQLRGNREADQRLCFRYIGSTIPLPPKYEFSCLE